LRYGRQMVPFTIHTPPRMPKSKSMQKNQATKARGRGRRDPTRRALTRMVSHVVAHQKEPGAPWPDKMRRTLKYSDVVNLTSTSAAVTVQQFKMNSCYQPDDTNTGHQPRGFEQLCSSSGPYTKYRVLGVRAVLEAVTTGASDAGMLAAGLAATGTVPTAPAGSGVTNIGGNDELLAWKACLVPSDGAPPVRLEFGATIAEIVGVAPRVVLDEDDYAALYNAAPTNLAWFNLQYQAGATATSAILVLFKLEMDVQFEDPILLAAS